MSKFVKGYFASLIEPKLVTTAVKVALIVGSILFIINHGSALWQGQMSRERWISAAISYLVPYCVNIHGQYVSVYSSTQAKKFN
ncbi:MULTISPECIES: nitrate/nitrite transporter NrtS [Cyanophyceae]|uniref:nitrate/nitrite transporter NrtS n=1 Tax=Cyanophyceae TaxID=3028117 RepID=UPI00233017A7|nr:MULTISPECIES: nitrate/nitrite transporter NrtS [Cyanophyceae]MDB9354687.1 nitrate/nitrite transporter NrtS [Nodularia spumigena CS-587/03]MDB9303017.1 nitrate/nitrite transporter NrtS [Nodularia spumigena CS-591/12]MDB9323870.1 nitrate/nitrite transporter NrtS [Nodularia spumigena CS-591/07A]MDB9333055.1 nitrate/nitrite transporter NrtS [Nodularia spumigena CS-591/04]MDB9341763.1 nitrate/nitrite transporter NrtS [Nodularia spumigena CS-589/07]